MRDEVSMRVRKTEIVSTSGVDTAALRELDKVADLSDTTRSYVIRNLIARFFSPVKTQREQAADALAYVLKNVLTSRKGGGGNRTRE